MKTHGEFFGSVVIGAALKAYHSRWLNWFDWWVDSRQLLWDSVSRSLERLKHLFMRGRCGSTRLSCYQSPASPGLRNRPLIQSPCWISVLLRVILLQSCKWTQLDSFHPSSFSSLFFLGLVCAHLFVFFFCCLFCLFVCFQWCSFFHGKDCRILEFNEVLSRWLSNNGSLCVRTKCHSLIIPLFTLLTAARCWR